MDEEEIIKNLINRCEECKFATCENCEINWNEVQALKNLVDTHTRLKDEFKKERKNNDKLKNQARMSAEEHGRICDKLEKMIDLLIDDLQMEGCLIDMTQAEIYRYYEKRILLEED